MTLTRYPTMAAYRIHPSGRQSELCPHKFADVLRRCVLSADWIRYPGD